MEIDPLGDAMESVQDSVVEWFSETIATVFEWFAAWWLHIGSFDLADPVHDAYPVVMWLAALVVLVGLARAAIGMALRQRADPMGQALSGLMLFTVVSAASLPVAQTLLELGDELSMWILDVMVDDTGDRLAEIANVATSLAPGLVIVVGIVVGLGGLVMFLGMILREAAIVFLVALMPLAAAGYVMRGSSTWFPRLAGWTAALMLWKPVAALSYGLSFGLLRGGEDDWRMLFAGIGMLALSIIALPMLIKLLVGWAGQTAGSGGPFSPKAAGSRMAMVGAGTALAAGGGAMAASRIAASSSRLAGAGAGGAASGGGASGAAAGASSAGGGGSSLSSQSRLPSPPTSGGNASAPTSGGNGTSGGAGNGQTPPTADAGQESTSTGSRTARMAGQQAVGRSTRTGDGKEAEQ